MEDFITGSFVWRFHIGVRNWQQTELCIQQTPVPRRESRALISTFSLLEFTIENDDRKKMAVTSTRLCRRVFPNARTNRAFSDLADKHPAADLLSRKPNCRKYYLGSISRRLRVQFNHDEFFVFTSTCCSRLHHILEWSNERDEMLPPPLRMGVTAWCHYVKGI